jgi:phosphopantothenoylcysteine synthetase/decarboxylase
MKGNVKDIKEQVGGELATTFVAMATVKTVVKDDEAREYQSVYNKAFLPAYSLKNFRLVNYSDTKVLETLRQKKTRDLKPHERFVVNVTGEYGCKEFYIFRDLKDYSADDNFVASDKAISEDGADY